MPQGVAGRPFPFHERAEVRAGIPVRHFHLLVRDELAHGVVDAEVQTLFWFSALPGVAHGSLRIRHLGAAATASFMRGSCGVDCNWPREKGIVWPPANNQEFQGST
jgi:hypothetical protein